MNLENKLDEVFSPNVVCGFYPVNIGMATNDAVFSVTIKALDQASQVINNLNKNLKAMRESAEQANSSANESSNRNERRFKDLLKWLNLFGKGARTELNTLNKNFTELGKKIGGTIDTLSTAFKLSGLAVGAALAIKPIDALANSFAKATDNAVSLRAVAASLQIPQANLQRFEAMMGMFNFSSGESDQMLKHIRDQQFAAWQGHLTPAMQTAAKGGIDVYTTPIDQLAKKMMRLAIEHPEIIGEFHAGGKTQFARDAFGTEKAEDVFQRGLEFFEKQEKAAADMTVETDTAVNNFQKMRDITNEIALKFNSHILNPIANWFGEKILPKLNEYLQKISDFMDKFEPQMTNLLKLIENNPLLAAGGAAAGAVGLGALGLGALRGTLGLLGIGGKGGAGGSGLFGKLGIAGLILGGLSAGGMLTGGLPEERTSKEEEEAKKKRDAETDRIGKEHGPDVIIKWLDWLTGSVNGKPAAPVIPSKEFTAPIPPLPGGGPQSSNTGSFMDRVMKWIGTALGIQDLSTTISKPSVGSADDVYQGIKFLADLGRTMGGTSVSGLGGGTARGGVGGGGVGGGGGGGEVASNYKAGKGYGMVSGAMGEDMSKLSLSKGGDYDAIVSTMHQAGKAVGLNDQQIKMATAGFLSNFAFESNLRHDITRKGGSDTGWAQWVGPRLRHMQQYGDPHSLEANQKQLFYELTGPYKSYFTKAANAKTPTEAALAGHYFESGGAPQFEGAVKSGHIRQADNFYKRLGDVKPEQGKSAPAASGKEFTAPVPPSSKAKAKSVLPPWVKRNSRGEAYSPDLDTMSPEEKSKVDQSMKAILKSKGHWADRPDKSSENESSHRVQVSFDNAPAGMRSRITESNGSADLNLRTRYSLGVV